MQISKTTSEKKLRIRAIHETPLRSKERDIITAAERYLAGVMTVPMITHVAPCFTKAGRQINQSSLEKIARVWRFNIAAYHLQHQINTAETHIVKPLLMKSKSLYEQEAQRILGSIFPIESSFWNDFYIRQDKELTKNLVAIDAIHHLTGQQNSLAHQLITQSIKYSLLSFYMNDDDKLVERNEHINKAEKLIMDLPLEELKIWIHSLKTMTYSQNKSNLSIFANTI